MKASIEMYMNEFNDDPTRLLKCMRGEEPWRMMIKFEDKLNRHHFLLDLDEVEKLIDDMRTCKQKHLREVQKMQENMTR